MRVPPVTPNAARLTGCLCAVARVRHRRVSQRQTACLGSTQPGVRVSPLRPIFGPVRRDGGLPCKQRHVGSTPTRSTTLQQSLTRSPNGQGTGLRSRPCEFESRPCHHLSSASPNWTGHQTTNLAVGVRIPRWTPNLLGCSSNGSGLRALDPRIGVRIPGNPPLAKKGR